jgi:hypothetical protein
MTDTPYWDDVIVDAVKVATSPGLFTDATKTFRELFEKKDYVSMGVKAWEEYKTIDPAGTAHVVALLVRKQSDYGSANIMDGPYGPRVGIRVRLWDKVARYENLTREESSTASEPYFESLEDTLLDIIGYVCLDWMVAAGAMNYPLSTEGTK